MASREFPLLAGMSFKEIAAVYGVSYKTMLRWIKPIRKKYPSIKGRALKPWQLNKIIDHLDQEQLDQE